MPVLCIQGLQSRMGSSTVIANLARNLHEMNQDVLVIDLKSTNLLRLHFNMDWSNSNGWALNVINDQPWFNSGFKCEYGVSFMPFGRITYENKQFLFNEIIEDNWLSNQLRLANFSDKKWIILNVESELNPLSIQALNYADKIIRLIEPQVTCLGQFYDSIQSNYFNNNKNLHDKSLFLINKLMPLSELDHEMALVFKSLIPNQLIPVKIHFDEHVKEAFAQKTTVQFSAPDSAAAKQFRVLATWLILQFSDKGFA
jgi:cellulose synthase operon protein YhjQ